MTDLSRDMSRRHVLQAGGLAGLGLLGAACAGPGSSSGGGGGGGDAAPVPDGKVAGNVSFAHWRAEDQKVFASLLKRFGRTHPDVSVEQHISPSADYQASALQRIRGGSVGDVFTAFRGAQFLDMAKAGLFADLSDEEVVGAFSGAFLDVGRADGAQLGLPYQLVFNQPVVNLEAWDSAGVTEQPPSWDAWLDMCDKVKSKGLVPIAWPGGEPGNAGQLFNCMVMNNAPSPDMCTKIEQGEYAVTDDWFLTTLRQYAELRPYFQPNAAGTQVEPAEQMFAEGKAGMLATGSYHMAPVRDLGARFPFDLTAPVTTTKDEARYVGTHNATFILGVNTDSDVQAAGLALVEFLARPEVASEYANETGQHLTVSDVRYTSRDLKATASWLDKKTLAAPRYQFTNLDVASAVENACIQVVGGTKPEQAAEKAQRIVDQKRA